jgi:6-pyruvoyltetrahydropterin/6-carboxytetrahydropterin synthase
MMASIEPVPTEEVLAKFLHKPQQLYFVTKKYGHELGLSTTFRQWKATSHCRFMHGYALAVELDFCAPELNANNWVIDFGSLKPVKQWLCDTFDHKLIVAEDDPYLDELTGLQGLGLVDALVVPFVGCEAFAKLAWDEAQALLAAWEAREVAPLTNGVRLVEVEVREHGANSAIYLGGN